MVSVFTIPPMVRRFKPCRGDGFLSSIKICTMSSFGEEVKPGPLP
jgi:hypothetical protein